MKGEECRAVLDALVPSVVDPPSHGGQHGAGPRRPRLRLPSSLILTRAGIASEMHWASMTMHYTARTARSSMTRRRRNTSAPVRRRCVITPVFRTTCRKSLCFVCPNLYPFPTGFSENTRVHAPGFGTIAAKTPRINPEPKKKRSG